MRPRNRAKNVPRTNRLLLPALLGALLAAACGGGGESAPAKTADDEATRGDHEDRPAMSASAEIGALDEGKVTSAFRAAQGALQRCLAKGAERNELEGGDIAFVVKIDTSGRAVHAHVEKSTIGDRETERCMLSALKKQSWPAPVGGDIGVAKNGFGFDMPNDSRPPTEWEADRVSDAVASVSSKIAACKKGTRGDLTATVYVDPDGAATSVGIAASDDSGEDAADCLAEALRGAKYPSPGSWPAKVTFSL
ncbi:MAG TPA: AgmX/PglI C-terminal domain-containing protein [Polyangiaceae bacterium]|nr:AgmX/PglI C-terminal domain-containing protein [Polyangiaceae bacterium]